MPREFRNIYFDESELKIALMHFSARKKRKFNAENIKEVLINLKEEISVTMKVFDIDSHQVGTIKYGYSEVAAALIGYCMFLKIPLPKTGKKSIHAKDGALYLTVKFG